MLVEQRDSDATLHHDRESAHHLNAVPGVQRLRSHQLIDPCRGTHRSRTVRREQDR